MNHIKNLKKFKKLDELKFWHHIFNKKRMSVLQSFLMFRYVFNVNYNNSTAITL